jgi:hypothetical protein
MKRLLTLLAIGFLFSTPALAQTYKLCGTAATSSNASCIGVPDTSAAAKENMPSSAGTVGQLKKVTGIASDSSANTAWANQNAQSYVYLACAPTLTSVSSGTSETVIGSCAVPGGLMDAHGILRVRTLTSRSNTAHSDTVTIRIGTANNTSGTSCATASSSSNLAWNQQVAMFASGTTATNACATPSDFANISTNAAINIDTTNPVWVILTGTPGTTGDVLTALSMKVEYLSSTAGGQ